MIDSKVSKRVVMADMFAVYLAVAGLLAIPISILLWIGVCHLLFAWYHWAQGWLRPRMDWQGTYRYYRQLLFATLQVTGWTLLRAGRGGIRRPIGQASGQPVLLVHGYFRNGSCMWGLRQALERRGRPTLAVSMGRPSRPIERYVPALEKGLRELAAAFPGQRVDIVAHSMGGVVLRLALARRSDLGALVGQIVTLGSPHRGTALVNYLVPLPNLLVAPEHRQLRPGSRFLECLPDFSSSAPGVEVTTVAAERDFIVYPKSTSHLPGCRAIDLAHANHQSLLCGSEALQLVVELLTDRQAQPPAPEIKEPIPASL